MGRLALELWTEGQNQGLVMGSAAPGAGQPGLKQDQGAQMGLFVLEDFMLAGSCLCSVHTCSGCLGRYRSAFRGDGVGL